MGTATYRPRPPTAARGNCRRLSGSLARPRVASARSEFCFGDDAAGRGRLLQRRRPHDRAGDRILETAIPACDRDTRGEPLHVPLERPREGLVEVVDAEDEPPIDRKSVV